MFFKSTKNNNIIITTDWLSKRKSESKIDNDDGGDYIVMPFRMCPHTLFAPRSEKCKPSLGLIVDTILISLI